MTNNTILLFSVIIIICILVQKITDKIKFPPLLVFLTLGMLCGSDGLLKINFQNYNLTSTICNYALIFIMFSGGFSTNIKQSKSVLLQGSLLSTVGVLISILILGPLIYLVFRTDILYCFLLAAVVGSTDSATVFNILKNSKLNLKHKTAELLTIESGSNDPMAYSAVIIIISLIKAVNKNIPILVIKQFLFGILIGYIIYKAVIFIINSIEFSDNTTNITLIFGALLLTYSLCSFFDGNAFLGVYVYGIFLGNAYFKDKSYIIRFYDSITNLSQIVIFFLLGLLVNPSSLPGYVQGSIIVFILLTLFARPISSFIILKFFKSSFNQIVLVSLAGLRGASSIVFSIIATIEVGSSSVNIFNLIFIVVLLSMFFQGLSLPYAAKKLKMIDNSINVFKTFNDYQDDNDVCFMKIPITKESFLVNTKIKDFNIKSCRIAMLIRNKKNFQPTGDIVMLENDILVLTGAKFINKENLVFTETYINNGHEFINKDVKDIKLDENKSIIIIKRNKQVLLPQGDIKIKVGDVLVISSFS